MTPEYFKRKTTEELKASYKTTKVVLTILSFILLLLLSIAIYGFFIKNNKPVFISIFVVGLFCLGTLPYQIKSMNKIKDEINKRQHLK